MRDELVLVLTAILASFLTTVNGLQKTDLTSKSLDVRLDESNVPKSRRKRSVIFPTGSDLSFDVGLSIPISALSATSKQHSVLRLIQG